MTSNNLLTNTNEKRIIDDPSCKGRKIQVSSTQDCLVLEVLSTKDNETIIHRSFVPKAEILFHVELYNLMQNI